MLIFVCSQRAKLSCHTVNQLPASRQVGMIFSSPVPQKACTSSPSGSRCMLFAGQVMKTSYPPVVQRVITTPSAYATDVDYNVYFQRNTLLVVLFMFTVINFHISMMVECLCDYKFWRFSLSCYLSHVTTKPTQPRTL